MRRTLLRKHVLWTLVSAVLTVVVSAGLLGAAVLVPAPPAALVLVVLVCIGCPMVAAWELSRVTAAPAGPPDLRALRRQLDRLPETQHPLGL
jgi:hypothetical protein